jgi:hypothetical protein
MELIFLDAGLRNSDTWRDASELKIYRRTLHN